MRQTRDTFLHFIGDNIVGVPVHNVRRDTSVPESELIQLNAVNIKFLDVSPDVIGTTLVDIAVCFTDELTALATVKKVYDLLQSAFYTPKKDYTIPASPVPTGTNIFWRLPLQFRRIYSDTYADFRITLTLTHKVDS